MLYVKESLLSVSFFLFSISSLTNIDSIDNILPTSVVSTQYLVLLLRRPQSHTNTHTRDGNISNKPSGWGGGHLFPPTASFLRHSAPPSMPGVKGKGGEENKRSAHLLPHKHITGPCKSVSYQVKQTPSVYRHAHTVVREAVTLSDM